MTSPGTYALTRRPATTERTRAHRAGLVVTGAARRRTPRRPPEPRRRTRREFDERREACRKVSDAFQCTWVPFQRMFDEAVENTEPAYWGGDGVHPSVAGHALMAKTWLETVNTSS